MDQLVEWTAETIGIADLDAMDDTALDRLPFGVVAMDADGIARRYNATEAQLAGLDRERIVGAQRNDCAGIHIARGRGPVATEPPAPRQLPRAAQPYALNRTSRLCHGEQVGVGRSRLRDGDDARGRDAVVQNSARAAASVQPDSSGMAR